MGFLLGRGGAGRVFSLRGEAGRARGILWHVFGALPKTNRRTSSKNSKKLRGVKQIAVLIACSMLPTVSLLGWMPNGLRDLFARKLNEEG